LLSNNLNRESVLLDIQCLLFSFKDSNERRDKIFFVLFFDIGLISQN